MLLMPILSWDVQSLFADADDEELDQLAKFLIAVRTSHEHSSKLVARYFTSFVLFWVLIVSVAHGWVREGAVSSFKLADVTLVLTVAPVVLGALFYLLGAQFGWSNYLGSVLRQTSRQFLPKLEKFGLLELDAPPTIINIERAQVHVATYQYGRETRTIWIASLFIGIVVACVAAFGQTCYIAVKHGTAVLAVKLLACIVGMLLAARGLFLAKFFVDAS